MVDMQISHYIDGVLYNKVPATLAFITGDSDYKPVLQTTVQLEIYFWDIGMSLYCNNLLF